MTLRTFWHLTYGGALAALVAAGVSVGATNPGLLWREISNIAGSLKASIPVLLSMYAMFTILERAFRPAGPRKPLQGYLLNFKVLLFEKLAAPVLGGLSGIAIISVGNHMGLGLIDLRFSTGHGTVDLVLGVLLIIFIFDFFFYWMHRFQHESFLWQQHKLHHMDEQICAFTREHWIEVLLAGLLIGLPMAILFKFNRTDSAITGAAFLAWNTLIHSNIRLHLGPVAVVFNGPQGHRIHHSRAPEHYDRNFAAYFPIWDVLFGTYHYPREDEYPLTGVEGEKEVQTLREATLLPICEWHKMFRAWRVRRSSVPT